jgi:hypothetical protein
MNRRRNFAYGYMGGGIGTLSRGDELEYLRGEHKALERMLGEIDERIKLIESEKKGKE